MAKVTINDIEYETDDFTEAQMSAFNELRINQDERDRASYRMHLLTERSKYLTSVFSPQQDEGE